MKNHSHSYSIMADSSYVAASELRSIMLSEHSHSCGYFDLYDSINRSIMGAGINKTAPQGSAQLELKTSRHRLLREIVVCTASKSFL